jgi:hypothetical protein
VRLLAALSWDRASYFLLHLKGSRGNDLNAFLAGLHGAQLFFPWELALYQRAALHGNQDGIVKTVIVELGHSRKIFRALLAVENTPDSIFQLVRDLLHAAGWVFRGDNKGMTGLGADASATV